MPLNVQWKRWCPPRFDSSLFHSIWNLHSILIPILPLVSISPPFFRNNLFPQLICSLSPPRIDHFQKHAHRRQATPQITRGNGLPQGHFPEPDQNGTLPRIRSFPLGGFWRHPSHSILWSVGSRKEDTHHGSVARDVWKRSGEGEFSIRISSIAACGEARIQSGFPR